MKLMKVVLMRGWANIHFGGSNAQYEFWLGLVRMAMNTSPRLVGRASEQLYKQFQRFGIKP